MTPTEVLEAMAQDILVAENEGLSHFPGNAEQVWMSSVVSVNYIASTTLHVGDEKFYISVTPAGE